MLENNPSEYRELVKELKDEGQASDPADKIPADEWIKHFTTLFSVQEDFKHIDLKYTNDLQNIEKIKTFSELDFAITEKEYPKLFLH